MAALSPFTEARRALTDERYVLLLIAAALVGRLVFAGTLGLGIDERYTVATARTFALSTFDHPPLAWWLAGGARWLFGTESALAVRLPFILLFALTTWLMFAFTRQLFGSRAGLFAALTLNLAPVLAWTTGSFVLPDGPLIAATMAGASAWPASSTRQARHHRCGGWRREPVAALPACPSCTGCSCSPARRCSC